LPEVSLKQKRSLAEPQRKAHLKALKEFEVFSGPSASLASRASGREKEGLQVGGRVESDLVAGLREFLAELPQVKFAYLFGSHARGSAGPLSDVDIAVYLDGRLNEFDYRLTLIESLARKVRSDDLDVIALNSAPVLLAFDVIRDGIVLKDDRSRRVIFEAKVIRDYLDTAHLREVQCQYLKERFRRGPGNG
jgi:uncharacterized protein